MSLVEWLILKQFIPGKGLEWFLSGESLERFIPGKGWIGMDFRGSEAVLLQWLLVDPVVQS